MPVAAPLIIAGGAIAGGAIASSGAKSAANAQVKASDAGIAEQQHEFDTLLGLTAPQRQIGNEALNELAISQGYAPYSGQSTQQQQPLSFQDWVAQNPQSSIGMGGGFNNMLPFIGAQQSQYQNYVNNFKPQAAPAAAAGTPNYSAFYNAPGYQFSMDQGLKAVQNSAAAQGGLYSGNALRGINDYAQGQASNQYNNWFNQQAALAGIGQAATGQAGNAAISTGNNISSLLAQQGDARASGITGQSNAISNSVNQLGMLYGLYSKGYFNKPSGG